MELTTKQAETSSYFCRRYLPVHVLWLASSERLERSFLIRSAVDTRESYIESLILSTIFSSFFLNSVKQKALPGNLLICWACYVCVSYLRGTKKNSCRWRESWPWSIRRNLRQGLVPFYYVRHLILVNLHFIVDCFFFYLLFLNWCLYRPVTSSQMDIYFQLST